MPRTTGTAPAAVIELWRLQARMARDVVNANTHGLTHEESLVEPRPGGNRLNWVLGHLLSVYDGFLPLLKQEPVIGAAALQQRLELPAGGICGLPNPSPFLGRQIGDAAQNRRQLRLATQVADPQLLQLRRA